MSAASLLAFVLASLFGIASAQSNLWGQCGGLGWTGSTTCVSGAVCTKQNDYYSQCLPGTSASPTAPPVTSTTPIASPPKPTAGSPNLWFSFGDSYTQTGFTTTGAIPAIGNPLGNPPYPGYTAVGGTNWIDLATVQFNKSLILTYNYAYGGATIDASLVTPYQPTVLSLTDQVNQFLSTVANKPATAPWTSENSLFSFWIGINDIGNSYGSGGDRDAFSDTLLNAYFALVQKLVSTDSGARNLLFINVPPVDRSPLMLAQSASAQSLEKSVINGFNAKLAMRVSQLKANNSVVTTYIWDSNAAFSTVLNSPQTYGFVDATSFGGTNNFWGNNYHPSSAAHAVWATDIADVLANTIW